MKKFFVAAFIAALSLSSQATVFGTTNNDNSTTNAPVALGGAAQAGAAAGAVAGAASNANAIQGQGQQQGQALINSNASTSRGGNAEGGAAYANPNSNASSLSAPVANGGFSGGNNLTSVYQGAERSAPSIGAAIAPIQIRNCRIGIGAGGSNVTGAFTAAIPLGNDQTCLAGAKLEAMAAAGGFSTYSKVKVACTIEGMAELAECKFIAERDKAAEPAQANKSVALLP